MVKKNNSNIIYFVISDINYPKRLIFKLFDKIILHHNKSINYDKIKILYNKPNTSALRNYNMFNIYLFIK